MSDHEQPPSEEEQRAQRRDSLRQLAWDQTGEAPAVAPTKVATRRLSGRVALAALAICVVLAGTGCMPSSARANRWRMTPPISPTTQTSAPACARSPSASPATAASGVPQTATNIRVSNDTYKAHSEPMLAINPANPLNLVGGSKFFTDPARYRFQIGTYTSFDGGCSWTDNGVLPGFAPSETTSDVTMAFGPKNRVYVAVLYTDDARDSGIAVSTSTDGGKTFGQPVRAYDDPTGAVFSDKPWIAVDSSGGPYNGSVYIVWSYDFGGSCGYDNACQQGLGFARSTDGGATFSPVRQVEGEASFCANPATGRPPDSRACDGALGAIPAILPDGTLAVAFDYMDVTSSGRIPTRLVVVTSPDGGVTWTPPVLIATISDILGLFPPDRYRNASLPAFAADPAHGRLYITWADKATGDADILFSSSSDAGRTWSAPLRVNDDPAGDGANQFQPQLAVAPNGVVTISFFDTRRDPKHHLIDVYLAQSVDGGATFLPNVRVTAQSWDPTVDAPVDGSGLQFIGDYQGLAVDNQFALPFWNDTRTGSQEIFTALVPSAQP